MDKENNIYSDESDLIETSDYIDESTNLFL